MKSDLARKVAWIDHPDEIRAIVLSFCGLGGTVSLKSAASPDEQEWKEAGALVVCPYYNPWAWMNGQTVRFVDDLIGSLTAELGLDPSLPVVATGGSMGGHAALTYTLKSARGVAACFANCPVCDLVFHYSERPDLPRTMHSAFGSYGDITETLREYSPLWQAGSMPRIPYFFVHGVQDRSVSKAAHSDKLVHLMCAAGHQVAYYEEPEMGHCHPMSPETHRASMEFIKGVWS